VSLLEFQVRNPDAGTLQAVLNGELGGPVLPLSVSSIALASSLEVKSGRGILFGFTGYNTNAAAQYILVFDCQAAPVAGQIPETVVKADATGNFFAYWGSVGKAFQSGCWLCNSSTVATLTAGGADCWFDAQYI